MVSLRKLMPVVALLAGTYVTGSVSRAEDMDMKKVMEEIRAIKAQNAELQKQVATLKTGDVKKASAEVAVDKALKTHCTDDGFFHDADLHPRKIKIGGLVDFTYQYNINNPGERYNTLRSFDNYQSNDFALNMANIYFDGTAKERGEAGFMIDLGFGRDASSSVAGNVNTGLAYDNVLQAYINYIAPIGCKGVEMMVGKFYTPIGFEVAKGDNWNITRSLNFAWTQPLSHTGGQLAYQVLDQWKVKAGIVNSFYNRTAQDNNNAKTYYASSTWNPGCMKNFSWTITGMIGQEEARQTDVLLVGGAGGTSPALTNAYGDLGTPLYTGPGNFPTGVVGNTATGTGLGTLGQRGDQSRNMFTVNNIVRFDPWETLHFGFEGNFQLKEGVNYKKDDLIGDPGTAFQSLNGGATASTPAAGPFFPSSGSLGSTYAALVNNNIANGVAPQLPNGLTVAQTRALYNYYNNADRGNAYTWGAAAYMKWDFQKNWYVALRGEYISDQDNLNFRNDNGVAAQNTNLAAAKTALFPGLNYAVLPTGITAAQYANMIQKLDKRDNTAWSVTATVGWNITKSLKWKAEYRHDEADKDVFYKGGAHKANWTPYTPSTSTGQDTVSMQMQYSF